MTAPTIGLRRFSVFWLGEFVSLNGSAISSFALLVYIFINAESVTPLGIAYALPIVPFMLASPFAGSLVDRWGAKFVLLLSNIGNLITMLVLALLIIADMFAVWQVYVVVGIASLLKALQLPAFEASVALVVPKRQLGRANGMRMLFTGVGAVAGPVIGGVLILAIDIDGVILLDCVSFAFAILTLLFVRIPHARPESKARTAAVPTLMRDFREAAQYIAARPGLIAVMVLLSVIGFGVGFAELLLPPLVLAFGSPAALGTVMSVGALGMVVTSGVLSAWGGPRRRVRGAVVGALVFAAAIVLASLRPSVALIAVAAFIFLGSTAVIVGSLQTTWQTKVTVDLMGRTAALKNAIIVVPQAIANLVAGFAADQMLPVIGRDEVRIPVVAALVGNGPGRSHALLLMLLGIVIALVVVLVSLHPRLRNVEDELPDAIPDVPGEELAVAAPTPARV